METFYPHWNRAYTLLRVGSGLILSYHGIQKLMAGSSEFVQLGEQFASLVGFEIFPYYLGLAAALLETIGGLAIAAGLFFRWAVLAALPVIVFAFLILVNNGASFSDFSNSLQTIVVLTGLLFIGPGTMSVDYQRGHRMP